MKEKAKPYVVIECSSALLALQMWPRVVVWYCARWRTLKSMPRVMVSRAMVSPTALKANYATRFRGPGHWSLVYETAKDVRHIKVHDCWHDTAAIVNIATRVVASPLA